jgi:5-methylcytosine-specific restriction endonuclease McrA
MDAGQVDFDAPLAGRIDKTILDAVRGKSGTWDGSCKEVVALRAAVLAAQGHRCTYCRRVITVNEVGHREMDHILPKSQSPVDGFDAKIASDDSFDMRRHTRGYPAFTFEPENLAVSCKRCNSYKGTFDPLMSRAVAPKTYPGSSTDFLWMHPFHDTYGHHIAIQGGGIYVIENGSKKGEAVVKTCGLDKSGELTRMYIQHYVRSNLELANSMCTLVFSVGVFDIQALAEEYSSVYHVADTAKIADCLTELLSAKVAGIGVLNRALASVQRTLGTYAPIYAPKVNAVL